MAVGKTFTMAVFLLVTLLLVGGGNGSLTSLKNKITNPPFDEHSEASNNVLQPFEHHSEDDNACDHSGDSVTGVELETAAGVDATAPSYLVSHAFMGFSVQVNPKMAKRLTDVEKSLKDQYDKEDAATRPATLKEYAGLRTIRGWRSTTTFHGSGSAVDCNYDDQPYIPTRSADPSDPKKWIYGGEEGKATPETRALRKPATEVYDRAVDFVRRNPYDATTADVNIRRKDEEAGPLYDRFKLVSESVAKYFSLAFSDEPIAVARRPLEDPEKATDQELLDAIPERVSKKTKKGEQMVGERKSEKDGIAAIEAHIKDPFWAKGHTENVDADYAKKKYYRILRDYEIIRKPLQYGFPDTRPSNTRNPARGFLHMEKRFVVAMLDAGQLRWGICGFGEGASGDTHHFDLGSHGGYTPE